MISIYIQYLVLALYHGLLPGTSGNAWTFLMVFKHWCSASVNPPPWTHVILLLLLVTNIVFFKTLNNDLYREDI